MSPRTPYPGLESITDPAVKRILKLIFDKVGTVEQQAQQIGTVSQPLTTHMDAGGKQINALADPTAPQDAVSLRYLQRYVESRVQGVVGAALATVPGSATGPPGPPPPPPPQLGAGIYMFCPKVSPPLSSPPQGANEWPPGTGSPDSVNIQYTVWLVVQVAGVWYTSGFIQMWIGRPDTGSSPIGSEFARNWAYDTRWGPMNGQSLPPGSTVGMFVSAGNARGQSGVTTVRERSEVVQVAVPDANASPPDHSLPIVRGFDLATATVYNSPADIASWPVTGGISKVTWNGSIFQ